MTILLNKTSAHIRPILPATSQKPVNRKVIGLFVFYFMVKRVSSTILIIVFNSGFTATLKGLHNVQPFLV